MKYKTAELEGDALDYMVQCAQRGEKPLCNVAEWAAGNDDGWHPSTNPEQGHPILERLIASGFDIHPEYGRDEYPVMPFWCANMDGDSRPYNRNWGTEYICTGGPTILIAAMRAYVTGVFGEEVEIP